MFCILNLVLKFYENRTKPKTFIIFLDLEKKYKKRQIHLLVPCICTRVPNNYH